MKRIIFVGVHNKPGFKPLDSKSRSGRIIDKVIEKLSGFEILKTNLWNIEYFPYNYDYWKSIADLKERIDYNPERDILIGLGATVNDVLQKTKCKYVSMGHPSAVWSHEARREYIERCLERLNKYLEVDV